MTVDADMKDLLVRILAGEDFTGRDELLAQVDHVRVVGGPVAFYELDVDRVATPTSPIETTRVPGNAWAYDRNTPLGTLIVWVSDGYISGLEYGWTTDDEPTCQNPVSVSVSDCDRSRNEEGEPRRTPGAFTGRVRSRRRRIGRGRGWG